MAILEKTKPGVIDYLLGKINITLQLRFDAAETPWASCNVNFYTLAGAIIAGATQTDISVTSDGKVNITNLALGDMTTGQYLVQVEKTNTSGIVTNKRVIVFTTEPQMTYDNATLIDYNTKTITFEYLPTYAEEPLRCYRVLIADNTSGAILENSDWIKAQAGVTTFTYNYDMYLAPETSYKIWLQCESKSGLLTTLSPVITTPEAIDYATLPKLVDIKPIVTRNEQYGYVRISMPKEIIKYCSNVSLSGNNYNITISNLYGCDTTQSYRIYTSPLLNDWVAVNTAPSSSKVVSVPKSTFTPTEMCCAGFQIKGNYRLVKEIRPNEFKELSTIVLPADKDYYYDDYDVVQGYGYKYYLLLNNEGLAAGATPALVRPQWDSIILSDNNGKMLSIQYNPQVSSFKSTILEQKQDTLGNRFPFFFRNGDLNYKEIPISGLISYEADPDNKFGATHMPEALPTTRTATYTVSSTALPEHDAFYLERNYKREVEDWLNNGEPKLLRTAAEGTFIVRLMNVSLSPMQQLGRRLHTFSATAYEIAEPTQKNLESYGFLCLNSTPSSTSINTSDALETSTGTANDVTQNIVILTVPDGLGEEKLHLNFSPRLLTQPTKVLFRNMGSSSITYVSNIAPGESNFSIAANDSREFDFRPGLWCYALGNVGTSARVEIKYPSATITNA